MSELSRQSYPDPPTLVGLCPGEHLGEFYVPREPGESPICPMCDERLILYVVMPDDEVNDG